MFPFSPGSSKSANYLSLDIEMYNITIYSVGTTKIFVKR